MGIISIPLSSEDEAVLHQLAETHHASDTEIAAAGLRAYLHFESAQIGKIRAGLDAANRGAFVPDVDMEMFFAGHGAEA